jgi:hypothetical protein
LPNEIRSGSAPSAQTHVQFAAAGHVEAGAERRQRRDHFGRGIRFRRIVNSGARKQRAQRAVAIAHHIDVEREKRRVGPSPQERVELPGHR